MLIWIVDDNGSLLEILEEVLANDYEVKTFISGEMFRMALTETDGSRPALLLIDWNLPGESTPQLLESFMTAYPEAQVAVMSGDLASVAEWPHDVYQLEKPFKLKDLQLWVRNIDRTSSNKAQMQS